MSDVDSDDETVIYDYFYSPSSSSQPIFRSPPILSINISPNRSNHSNHSPNRTPNRTPNRNRSIQVTQRTFIVISMSFLLNFI